MKYIKKPKGTAGRKGKYGWPQPLKDIFGITPAEYQFVFSIIKRLVLKKLDTTLSLSNQEGDNVSWVVQKTYKFIPKFKIYRGDWPIQAFVQSILKNANYQHQKLVRKLEASQDSAHNTKAATDDNWMVDVIDTANRAVDADSSDNEDPTKEADYDTSVVSGANMTFGEIGATIPFASHNVNDAYDALESDKDSNNFLRKLLPPPTSAPSLHCILDRSASNESNSIQVQRPRPWMRPPPLEYTPQLVSKPHSHSAVVAPTEQVLELLLNPVPAPISAPSPMPSPTPSPSPLSEPHSKLAQQGKRDLRATALTTSKTCATRAKSSSQSMADPNPTPKLVKQVKGKGRSRKVPQPEPVSERKPEVESEAEPEPKPAPKRPRRNKVGTSAGAESVPPVFPLALSPHSKSNKSGSATKEKAAPRSKQTLNTKGLSTSSRCQVEVDEDILESEPDLGNMSASRSNPPESLSDSDEEDEYEAEEESQPVATIARRNKNKLILLSDLGLIQEHKTPDNLIALAHNASQFVFVYANHPVSQSTPHIYVSMLLFWP
ncbi:hypothetical protein RSOLAG1IB_11785 [Rhizoctonia solani AG-1 IB]|uniref:Uncharacterized protein n=1 Tax=Thanatephorus cucumeris (strain AG1-IB / isolate 7/3/14) TaxID=1108050 RepID=A0A0B7FBC0_THACB|nr:hypothetical protein RSOLAG1IB_11785 [Rhizoctonia solani AG-1 IB]